MGQDTIYACQVVTYEGWRKMHLPFPGDVETYPDTIARLHCASSTSELKAKHALDDLINGWCVKNRQNHTFDCQTMVRRGAIAIYKNPGFGFRLKLFLKKLLS
jgi:hypothetical protein